MNNLKFIGVVAFLVTPLVNAAGVKTMSRDTFNDSNNPIWEVTVECNSGESKKIQQSINGGQWCSAVGVCADDKQALASQLCGGTAVVSATTTKPATPEPSASKAKVVSAQEREKLVREKIDIEQEQILIQQKRLELRRKELELQKRQANGA